MKSVNEEVCVLKVYLQFNPNYGNESFRYSGKTLVVLVSKTCKIVDILSVPHIVNCNSTDIQLPDAARPASVWIFGNVSYLPRVFRLSSFSNAKVGGCM